jgi:SecD/SecF fusion protein
VSRATAVRAVLALIVLGVSGWLVAARPARLGLDLRGGTQIVLETHDGELAKATAKTTDEALEVLRRRVDELGVAEPSLTRSGDRRIIVELPGVTDPREAVDVIGRTAQLTFRPVLGVAAEQSEPSPAPSGPPAAPPSAGGHPNPTPSAGADPREGSPAGEFVLPDERGQRLRLGPAALSGQQVRGAEGQVGGLAHGRCELTSRGTGSAPGSSSPARPPARRRAIRPGAWRSCWTTR